MGCVTIARNAYGYIQELEEQLHKERELADKLADELSCLANWREVYKIDCHYDPTPLKEWEEMRK